MTRPLRAILIGVPTPGPPTPPFAAATPMVRRMGNFLRPRFNPDSIVSLGPSTTKQDVVNAFAKMANTIRNGDLLVVMFAGHGYEATASNNFEAWALANGEKFTDKDLATAMLPFAGTDNVVINDCCFGGGMFATNTGSPPPSPALIQAKLAELSTSFATRLLNQFVLLGQPNFPLTCISAAGAQSFVFASVASELIEDTIGAATDDMSYARLNYLFQNKAFTGRTFQIEARPASNMQLKVIGVL